MPVSLGLGAAGKVASSLGGSGKAGPTSTENKTSSGTTASNTTGNSTSTPNLNPIMSGFQSSLVPALSSMYAKAQQPVYGAPQIAQVANQGDAATNAASSALSSNLARRGVLNSGASGAGQTALQAANVANTTNFENSIPLLNTQNEQQQTNNVLSLAEGLTGKALSTSSNSGNESQTGSTSGTSQTTASGPAFVASMLNGTGNVLSNAGAGKTGGGKTPTTTSLGNSMPGSIDSSNPSGLLNSLNPGNNLSDI